MAHSARIYDYILGGKDNFEADRKAAETAIARNPNMAVGMRANRAAMRRTTAYLAGEAAIRQFLDIGTGLPTSPNMHGIAQRIASASRVVYVDNDRCESSCVHAYGSEGALSRLGRPQPVRPGRGVLHV